MATADYVKYDAGQDPKFRMRDSSDTLPPAALPLASGSDQGAMSAAQFTKLAGIEVGATADQTAADVPFTPTGSIASSNVQDAIAEVMAEAGSGSGDVSGPGTTVVDNRIVRWDGTGGQTVQSSPVAISDAGAISGVTNITLTGTVDGVDVSSLSLDVSTHAAAASPHTGHATLTAGKVPLSEIPVLTSSQLGTDSVGSAQIAGNAVGSTEIANSAVTLAKMADVTAPAFLGRDSGTGPPEALTKTEALAALNVEDGAQANAGVNLGTGGGAIFKQVNGSGELEFRRINGGGFAPTSINVAQDSDNVLISLANNSVGTSQLQSDAVGYPQMKNLSGPVFMGRVSAVSGDPESITPTAAIGMLGIEAGAAAPPYDNADLAEMDAGLVKGREAGTGTGAVVDLTARQVRRNINVQAHAGAAFFARPARTHGKGRGRILTWKRVSRWRAGTSTADEVPNSHGNAGHLYPFMTFSRVNVNGHPHMDDDRLTTNSGPDLKTSVGCSHVSTGVGKFTLPIGGSWPAAWLTSNWAVSMGFANAANNGYWRITSTSGVDLFVEDPTDIMTTEATGTSTKEVRGISNRSGFNGYLEGLLIPADALRSEEVIGFQSVGFMENTISADAFLEFVLEPNPEAGVFDGASRVRCLTGELGATWTGKKPVFWECQINRGFTQTEFFAHWRLRVADVVDISGAQHVEGAPDFATEDVVLSPRFRVDQIANLDIYDDSFQDQSDGLLCEMQSLYAGVLN